ncbi:MAG: hypothetical protein ACYC7A_21745 [Thermoanaerobaculia bacterium]
MRVHPKLHGGKLTEIDEDGLDGIISVAEQRFGFQLTNIHTQGTSDKAGSTAARAENEWDDLGPKLQKALDAVPALNRASVSIRFRLRDGAHLHPNDLPRKKDRDQFVIEFASYLSELVPKLDRDAIFGHDLRPSRHGSLLYKYIREISLSWRRMDEDAPPLVQVGDLKMWTRMGADVMDEPFLRKKNYLTDSQLAPVRQKNGLSEFYFVLGGDPEAPGYNRQIAGDHLFVLHSLTHMRYVLDDSIGFDGIVVFHDGGNQLSVFCARCVRNHQALHNWQAKKKKLSIIRHRCATLTLQGPIARDVNGDITFDHVSVDLADESSWVIPVDVTND